MVVKARQNGSLQPLYIPIYIFPRAVQQKVRHYVRHINAHTELGGVIHAVGGLGGIYVVYVFGADRWANKNKIVVKVSPVQDFGGDRIEK